MRSDPAGAAGAGAAGVAGAGEAAKAAVLTTRPAASVIPPVDIRLKKLI